jgi:aminoglycoside 6'-N-acetyltransferase
VALDHGRASKPDIGERDLTVSSLGRHPARAVTPDAPTLSGERVTLRPLTDADLDALVDIIARPGVREWWPSADEPLRVREELRSDDGGYLAFAIEAGGELAGWLAVTEEDDPYYRHAALDIILAPGHQDRGLGTEALRTAIRWLIRECGHHRFTIDPALQNERAIRAYAAVGFRRVGVLRRPERLRDGSWRDGLLMELMSDELREPSG